MLTIYKNTTNTLPQKYTLFKDSIDIGFCILSHNNYLSPLSITPILTDLYIQEAYRGHNYSLYLLDYVINDAKTYGFSCIYLTTTLDNFYEKQGWTRIEDGFHLFFHKKIRVYKHST